MNYFTIYQLPTVPYPTNSSVQQVPYFSFVCLFISLLFRFIFIVICFLSFVSFAFSQITYNLNPTILLLKEKYSLINGIEKLKIFPIKKDSFQLGFTQNYYYNTNHPNFENHNGFYFPKGFGSISSALFYYNSKYISFSIGPHRIINNEYHKVLPQKKDSFSVNNDVPLESIENSKSLKFRNTGLSLHYSSLYLGYGNWNQWWGPGIHNSLVMTNNAEGIAHYFVGTSDYQPLVGDLKYYFKYMVSDVMHNNAGAKYFLSAYYFNLRYNNIELGKSRHILNGGYNDIPWSINDAMDVLITQNNIKYWDEIVDYYISANFPSSGLKIFLEVGFLNRSFNEKDPKVYSDHTMGSNLGLRKYSAFGYDELMFGFEYTRLVQGLYYDIIPTPNWYDNIKYNYSSYRGRRWAAHSGADSDDFLVFIGYINDRASIIYGVNYERHGVTYHFPPEVKFESRISVSFKYKNTFIYLNYENEYIEHYGFVDVNRNVWNETFEPGSIQRTQTLLISIEHTFSF